MEVHSMKTFHDLLYKEGNPFIKDMFKYGDRDALQLYGFWAAAGALGNIYEEYSRIFGLCRLLGGMNVYDIGCGWNYQACLLFHESIKYTGIDAYEHFDYDAMNRAFSDYCGKRIRFLNEHYPFRLSPDPNNAAVIRGWKYVKGGEKYLKKLTEAVSRDFDRVITNCGIMGVEWDENYRFWKQALPDRGSCCACRATTDDPGEVIFRDHTDDHGPEPGPVGPPAGHLGPGAGPTAGAYRLAPPTANAAPVGRRLESPRRGPRRDRRERPKRKRRTWRNERPRNQERP